MRVRCVELDVFSVDDDRVVVRTSDGNVRVVPVETAELATRCRVHRTIEEHAAAIAAELGLDDDARGPLRDELAGLVAGRLLSSEAELFEACRAVAARESTPPPITTLGVPTRDRPESLARSVESWATAFARHGRRVEVAVYDQTSAADVRAATRDRLRAIGRATGLGIRYAGDEEVRAWCARARARGAPGDLLAAFEGIPCRNRAENRNTMLLDTLGQLVLSVDDDTSCRLGSPPGADGGLRVQERPVFDASPYLDMGSALAASRPLDADVLALHEHVLGRSIAHAVDASRAAGVDVDDATPAWLGRIARGQARVAVTLPGMAGDAATTVTPHWLTATGPDFDRLFGDEEAFRSRYPTRFMVRSVPRTTIYRSDFSIAFCLAFDHREPLPPFLHFDRIEDGLFGLLLRAAHPDLHFAVLPHVVAHEPDPPRPALVEMPRSAGLAVGSLAMSWLDSCAFAPGAPTGMPRLRKLGHHLLEHAGADARELEHEVQARRLSERGELYANLVRLLASRPDPPARWAAVVRAAAEATEAGICGGPLLDLAGGCCEGDGPWDTLRLRVRRAGQTLLAWPDLVEVAEALAREGHRVSVPLTGGRD